MILLGFGLLFIGVSFLQDTFSPIKDSAQAQEVLIQLSGYPLLAVLAGTVLTILMQSSSASIMVIQVLALQGAFGSENWAVVLNLVMPFILGDNIGTTITAQLAVLRSNRMVKIARKATLKAITGLIESAPETFVSVRKREHQTDEFQYAITAYLSKLARRPLSSELSSEIPVLLHTVNDLERIGDLAMNIVEVAERKIGQGLVFSEEAMDEARQLQDFLTDMFSNVRKALKTGDKNAALAALKVENQLNIMQVELRKNHVRRMGESLCSPEAGLIFIDLVDNVEKIGDHLTNIAQSVIGGLQWEHHESKPEK